ncbi:putative periplasmic serine endoprotease DegP-like precursor [Planctomycetes bacterium MalM25]|nr:putative periplasmic serine endoprotease DegP-like precursor [Planctomycetes bacterium MalM25]
MNRRISLLALIGLAGVATYVAAQRTAPTPIVRQAPAPPPANLTPEELANIRVYEAANRSVVHITTSTVQYDPTFGLPIEGEGAGSGAILDRQGHIITNQHVIDGAREIKVALTNDRMYDATLVGEDAEYDIAVLKIDPKGEELTPLPLGRSDNLRVGQKAYALGNPFGLDHTLTCGVVSSLNRSLPSRVKGAIMDGMVQTDAAMNPGNSGGPLLNTSAEMIGMCVAIRSSVGQNSGVGFAIPIDRIRRFVPELIENGKIVRAYHGIVVLEESSRGLRIAKLSKNGPAERAGLRAFRVLEHRRREGPIVYRVKELDKDYADYILAIDGQAVSTHPEFLERMDGYQPGDRVVFTVLRDGQQVRVPVTLGAA